MQEQANAERKSVTISNLGSATAQTVKFEGTTTVGQALANAGIQLRNRESVRVNKVPANMETVLQGGEALTIVPAITGGRLRAEFRR